MDAFFVACELRRRPELRGRPVVVGGEGERGVVAAASYEARRFGVFSAMSSVRARRLCPDAVFLAGDHGYYESVSREVFAVFESFTPLVEGISLDEAFLDVTGSARLFGSGAEIAHAVRARIHDELHLTCSVGVAASKFVAKLASEAAKPRATSRGIEPGALVVEVPAGEELAFLHPLPVQSLGGVGPATLERLRRLGVTTIGDLAALPESVLVGSLGRANGRHLHELSWAVDDRVVEPDRELKSISHEQTFAHDLHERDECVTAVVRMADAVATRLRSQGLVGRTVTLKVRFHDFETITRSVTVPEGVGHGPAVAAAARRLMDGVDPSPGIRLLGVAVAHLGPPTPQQLSLGDLADDDPDVPAAWDGASRAVDEIRERYGEAAIGPARLVQGGRLRVARRGDQQWGPGVPPSAPDAPS
jgi:DNA polymerase IV